MREICTSGSVGGEGGNILAYPAISGDANWFLIRLGSQACPGYRLSGYEALLTPHTNGSGPCAIPVTVLRQAWWLRKKPSGTATT
jgi:hypothetical protein